MKNVFYFFIFSFLSFKVNSEGIRDYKYYQMDYSERYAVYVKKSDPCINVEALNKGTVKRFCEMGDSELNLEKDALSIYVSRPIIIGPFLNFIVAAPWNEQKCRIDLDKNTVTCEPTGK
ncbi:hypothetical protein A8139_02275 [Marinomonas primoryensis]|uniref:Uncharacterized protein n=1 Tax=Marinomonas primoryensis TaxID=178399 RepID=A0A2Z4PNC4_9GAMM|nr:hypothetical protein [Marinomonas primoryensis]AWX98952.1 hypothetical protein A8139_02275 [Marinomonas primoryensis]